MYSDPNITAKVICDSVNRHGNRLTTMVITYPRIIIAEVNTHRMLSKSTASSRAIPIRKQIEKVRTNMFHPSWVGAAQSGMQASSEVGDDTKERFKQEWMLSAHTACQIAESMDRLGIHKQIVNRVLEPYLYVTSIVTGTEWANLFKLRCHPDAQPEFMVLAYKMLSAYIESKPERTENHIPFGDQMEPGLTEEERKLVACARCARISYDTHDNIRNSKKDLELADSLIAAGHFSPFEHVAKEYINNSFIGNFRGWLQYRKLISTENVVKLDYEKLLLTKPSWI